MKVEKAVITAAGKGSRMKYITSVLPKALLPLFRKEDGKFVMRPVIDLILDSLGEAGVNKPCIVVGSQGKLLVDYLAERGVTFVTQNVPKGFGDAVLRAKDFVGNDPFFVHADDGVLTGGYVEATRVFEEMEPDAVLMVRKVSNPQRYGVVTADEMGERMGHKLLRVKEAEEKPKVPKSDLGISAVYIFSPKIMSALEQVNVTEGELELTYGIANILRQGGEVYAILLEKERWLNVGDPDNYFNALEFTYKV
ncbi:UTP--glucose-1-phosphate uridylyltransferase AglF [Metallosphaera sp. J1]|uniref:nucleotidyltransferase family protein n=1 Tax=Metallosphaera TaxID=41980 RepID=UPI001EDCD326|nr:sugar phosphate nucleotidyltransferase [Metallosphaera javensis (ex Hofmann et al. 2022)]MCG3109434.1 UTP--glucose-1-phosphate uridylyltransferase AglF [Metallosphaera javensis (ex Hofmann et al. 2022)]BCS92244.1 MAG: UTP--glucose-1-phosphate uridylyltransferase AglF [Metallosphaera javensis (ex Sakai et al. 2022)]